MISGLAWCVAIAAGAACYPAARVRRAGGGVDGAIAAWLGYAVVLGLLLASFATRYLGREDTLRAWQPVALALGGVVAAGIAARWLWRRRAAARGTPPPDDAEANFADPSRRPSDAAPRPMSPLARLGIAALAVLLLARCGTLLREIWLRPVYPWDAWAAWSVKPKTWVLLGHWVSFNDVGSWLAAPDGSMRTSVASIYPNTVAWLQVYLASAAGGWIEPCVHVAWFGAFVALLCAHYGQWRALGLRATRAAVCTYLLGSLPLLDVHVALAGYSDLWVATLLSLSLLSWLRWQRDRARGQLVLALVLAAVLPTIKLEGLVWCLLLLAVYAFCALPPRVRVILAAFALACLAAVLLGLPAWLLGEVGWLPALDAYMSASHSPVALLLHPTWHGAALGGVASALFAQSSWHLLWWFVVAASCWRWRVLVTDPSARAAGLVLLGGVVLLAALFLGTHAATWATTFTAVSRLVLQLAPVAVTLLALLLRDAPLSFAASDTDRARAAPTAPA